MPKPKPRKVFPPDEVWEYQEAYGIDLNAAAACQNETCSHWQLEQCAPLANDPLLPGVDLCARVEVSNQPGPVRLHAVPAERHGGQHVTNRLVLRACERPVTRPLADVAADIKTASEQLYAAIMVHAPPAEVQRLVDALATVSHEGAETAKITREGAVTCVHTVVNASPLEPGAALGARGGAVELPPEQHFVALVSYAAGLAEHGLEQSLREAGTDEDVMRLNPAMVSQLQRAVRGVAPGAAREFTRREIADLATRAAEDPPLAAWARARAALFEDKWGGLAEAVEAICGDAGTLQAWASIFVPAVGGGVPDILVECVANGNTATRDIAEQLLAREAPHAYLKRLELSIPYAAQETLAVDPSAEVRLALARHPSIAYKIAQQLASDPDEGVALYAAAVARAWDRGINARETLKVERVRAEINQERHPTPTTVAQVPLAELPANLQFGVAWTDLPYMIRVTGFRACGPEVFAAGILPRGTHWEFFVCDPVGDAQDEVYASYFYRPGTSPATARQVTVAPPTGEGLRGKDWAVTGSAGFTEAQAIQHLTPPGGIWEHWGSSAGGPTGATTFYFRRGLSPNNLYNGPVIGGRLREHPPSAFGLLGVPIYPAIHSEAVWPFERGFAFVGHPDWPSPQGMVKFVPAGALVPAFGALPAAALPASTTVILHFPDGYQLGQFAPGTEGLPAPQGGDA